MHTSAADLPSGGLIALDQVPSSRRQQDASDLAQSSRLLPLGMHIVTLCSICSGQSANCVGPCRVQPDTSSPGICCPAELHLRHCSSTECLCYQEQTPEWWTMAEVRSLVYTGLSQLEKNTNTRLTSGCLAEHHSYISYVIGSISNWE